MVEHFCPRTPISRGLGRNLLPPTRTPVARLAAIRGSCTACLESFTLTTPPATWAARGSEDVLGPRSDGDRAGPRRQSGHDTTHHPHPHPARRPRRGAAGPRTG